MKIVNRWPNTVLYVIFILALALMAGAMIAAIEYLGPASAAAFWVLVGLFWNVYSDFRNRRRS